MINLLDKIATIQKKTISQTASGTADPTYSTRIASLPCGIQGKQLRTANSFGKQTLVNGFGLYCEYNDTNTAIVEADRVVWGTRNFEIVGIKPGGGREHHLEIDMLEVK